MATKATGYLELDIKGFDSAIKTAKNLMVGFAAAFGAFKVGGFLLDGIKDAINFGKEMQSAGRAMGGFDPGKLLLAQKALEKVGMGAEEARGHIGDFIKEGRNISEIFGGADNYAKALQSAAKDYGSQANVLTRSGKELQTVFNTMEAISSKVRTFFLTMTEQFVGPLQVALDLLNSIDLAGVGADFGKAIGNAAITLLGLLKDGKMFNLVELGLKIAFQESVNDLIGGLNFVADYSKGILHNSLVSAFSAGVKFFRGAMDKYMILDLVTGITNAFIAAWAYVNKKYFQGIAELSEYMRASLIYAFVAAFKTGVAAGKTLISKDFWVSVYEGFKSFTVKVKEGLINAFQSAMEFLKNGLPFAFQKAIEGMKSLFTKGGGTISELFSAKSFDDIKNSSFVRADLARSVSGKFGKIEESSLQKAQPTIDKIKNLFTLIGTKFDGIKNFFTSTGTKIKASFKKGAVFDNSGLKSEFKKLLAGGFQAGSEMISVAGSNSAAPAGVLTNFSGSSSRVIADSLAKIGGGGNFLRVGMSLQEKTQIDNLLANKQTAEATTALHALAKDKKPVIPVIGQ
jgi:hypothetical protein